MRLHFQKWHILCGLRRLTYILHIHTYILFSHGTYSFTKTRECNHFVCNSAKQRCHKKSQISVLTIPVHTDNTNFNGYISGKPVQHSKIYLMKMLHISAKSFQGRSQAYSFVLIVYKKNAMCGLHKPTECKCPKCVV